MQVFLDSIELDEISNLNKLGIIDGVTTNPSLIAKSDLSLSETIKEICNIVSGPVSAEVIATDFATMIQEADYLRKIANNVTIKLPLTQDGLKACHALSKEGTSVNVTLCFSANQALLATKCGAEFISPFIGRLDDISQQGLELIKDIKQIYSNYPKIKTKILAASIRHTTHVLEVAKIGTDVATLPPKVLKQMLYHPLTDSGLEKFLQDAKYSDITIS